MTFLVVQGSVGLSKCHILQKMTFCTIEVFQENSMFQCKCHFQYTMKIHKYARTSLSDKYAHNITQCGLYIYIYCLHHITHYESIDFWLCLLMLKINILFNLFIKDCMFFTSTTKNFSGCLELIVMGHIHGFEEPWLFVLDGRPHHSPSLALNPNLHPNGFFYPIPNPPNKPCYTVHK